ncbi:sensor histidine kinase [Pedobacter sp. BMA]|uniref:sensor histidine kinase n=1 Tax=Pedobacter sp. BMA TaxID=1663685 RepID=UPI000649A5EE|nr:sensor histidine kinase [Pedobacter sp. BMA]KLT64044.1 hypothetical protein AB669_18440 [Pedobacter sp. BMA]
MEKTFYTAIIRGYTKGTSDMMIKIWKWVKINRIHFLGWSLYIVLETTLVGYAHEFGKPLNYTWHYALNIIWFYISAHWVLLKNFGKKGKKLLVFISLMALQIVAFVFIKMAISFILDNSPDNHFQPYLILVKHESFISSFNDRKDLLSNLWRCLQFIGFSCFYYLFLSYQANQKKIEAAEKQQLQHDLQIKSIESELYLAQSNYLRAQINPHLLYNTLNFIYDKARKYDDELAEGVMKLAEIMRYSIDETNTAEHLVKLSTELKQVQNLIYVMGLRKGGRLHLNAEYKGQLDDFEFLPIVVITLVENIFKHGNLSKELHPGYLLIEKTTHKFRIYTRNMLNTGIHSSGTNLGMKNIRHRLALEYKDAFSFNFGIVEENWFEVKLEVNL